MVVIQGLSFLHSAQPFLVGFENKRLIEEKTVGEAEIECEKGQRSNKVEGPVNT